MGCVKICGICWKSKAQPPGRNQKTDCYSILRPTNNSSICELETVCQKRKTCARLTKEVSSGNVSRNCSSSSSALSMRSAYSPMIQIMLALASGSSRVSRFSHKVAMMLSYLYQNTGLESANCRCVQQEKQMCNLFRCSWRMLVDDTHFHSTHTHVFYGACQLLGCQLGQVQWICAWKLSS